MSPDRKRGANPTRKDFKLFDKASKAWTDFADDAQYHRWAQAANGLSAKGWKPAQVIERLWVVRKMTPPPSMTGETAFQMAVAADAAERARTATSRRAHIPDRDELEFHASVMQTAALTDEQVVVRVPGFSMDNLPPHIFPADPKLPYYADPVTLAIAFMRQAERK